MPEKDKIVMETKISAIPMTFPDIGLINGISQNLSAFMTQMGLSGYPTGTVNENPYDQFPH